MKSAQPDSAQVEASKRKKKSPPLLLNKPTPPGSQQEIRLMLKKIYISTIREV
jgi:hypothetical protein